MIKCDWIVRFESIPATWIKRAIFLLKKFKTVNQCTANGFPFSTYVNNNPCHQLLYKVFVVYLCKLNSNKRFVVH